MVPSLMGVRSKPSVLCFDLDDTIVSFSAGQKDLWLRMLQQHAAKPNGINPHAATAVEASDNSVLARPCNIEALARVLDEVVTPAYWADPVRAAKGRLELFRSRREVLFWAACCYWENMDVAELARRWQAGELEMNGARFGESLFQIADAYTQAKEDAVAPFEDAIDVLHALRSAGFRLALITNGGSQFQRRKLERYGLAPLFEVIVIEGEWGVGKPHRSVFERALRETGCLPEQAWMIGDNYEADIVGASQLGIDGVWLHHGRPAPVGEVLPLFAIAHIRELLPLLT